MLNILKFIATQSGEFQFWCFVAFVLVLETVHQCFIAISRGIRKWR